MKYQCNPRRGSAEGEFLYGFYGHVSHTGHVTWTL